MPSAPIAQVFEDVNVTGEAISVVVRPQDETIASAESSYMMVDPVKDEDGQFIGYNSQTGNGVSLIGGDPGGGAWTYQHDSAMTTEDRVEFADQPTFKCLSASQHMFFHDLPAPKSFTYIFCGMMSQATLDLLDGGTAINRYLFTFYDGVNNAVKAGLTLFNTGTLRGWSMGPKFGVDGNGMNATWDTFPETKPTALVPFAIAWEVDWDTMISKFYYDDFSTPVTSKQHTEVLSDQERLDSRPWIYSFSPGGGTASWADWGKLQYFSQDEPSSRITTARRIAIRSELGAAYGF